MASHRLSILCITGFPPSPPTFGAQRRIHGLLSGLARRHDITTVSLIGTELDREEAERAMRAYCEPIFVQAPPVDGVGKRLRQLGSLFSPYSAEQAYFVPPALRAQVDALLSRRAFDVVQPEIYVFTSMDLRRAPAGSPAPRLVLDSHNVEYDLARQMSGGEQSPLRRFYNSVNWRKVRQEEHRAWRICDGVAFTSEIDLARARADIPSVRGEVVPNAVDVEYFRPRPGDPPPDGRTVLFFGTVDYFPNRDGLRWFLGEIWPRVEASHPNARLKIVGPRPTPEVLAARGPRVEVTGLVDDLRPHIAEAAVSIVPLRIGGGTRLKVVEAMAMAKPIVSTRLGAEGIDVSDGKDVLFADDPAAFAAAIGRVLDDPALGACLGNNARRLAEERYSWDAAAERLERFYFELREEPARMARAS